VHSKHQDKKLQIILSDEPFIMNVTCSGSVPVVTGVYHVLCQKFRRASCAKTSYVLFNLY
jgi:hypothetical protein